MLPNTRNTLGLGLISLSLLGCPSGTEEELSFYDQCIEDIQDVYVKWWERDGCIDDNGKGSGSIVSREEAGEEDYSTIGRFSLLFGENNQKDQCYNSTELSYQSEALQLTHAGADNGHIIDLGPEQSFEDISWGRTASELGIQTDAAELSALFYSLEDSEPQFIRNSIELVEGHSYLLRTSDFEYDLYAKLLITNYEPGELVEFDYEVLHIEAPEVLCQRRDDRYQEWKTNPPTEITLYDRATYNDYTKATFNAEWGTRDLVWTVKNRWDLTFARNEFLVSPDDQIAALGEVSLEEVSDAIEEGDLIWLEVQPVEVNQTYYVRAGDLRFAFQVLEFDEDDSVTFSWLLLD